MSDKPAPQARRNLFRAIALDRYRGPIEVDTPHVLPPWRPGLVVAALAIALAVTLLWI
tara:strand:+ start:528 stop:701 length:174 start_codon:yes stop_codon:yes gene_type:complete